MTITEANHESITQADEVQWVMTKAGNLHNAFKNAALFASTDSTLQHLNSVHLVERDGVLIAEATDRYKLIQIKATEPGDDVPEGLDILVPLDAVKKLEQALRPKKAYDFAARLAVNSDTVTLHLADGLSLPLELNTGDRYLAIGPLFPGSVGTDNGGAARYDPALLKALASVADVRERVHNHNMVVHPSNGTKPTPVSYTSTRGTWARALLMPTRMGWADGNNAWDAWSN